MTLAFFNIREEMSSCKSDRAKAILGTALIEDQLKKLLIDSSVKYGGFKKFIGRQQTSNLVVLSYANGLINKEMKNDIKCIIKIRNKFAHSSEYLHFSNEDILELINDIIVVNKSKTPSESPDLYCNYFIASIFLITCTLQNTIKNIEYIKNKTPFRQSLEIKYPCLISEYEI